MQLCKFLCTLEVLHAAGLGLLYSALLNRTLSVCSNFIKIFFLVKWKVFISVNLIFTKLYTIYNLRAKLVDGGYPKTSGLLTQKVLQIILHIPTIIIIIIKRSPISSKHKFIPVKILLKRMSLWILPSEEPQRKCYTLSQYCILQNLFFFF